MEFNLKMIMTLLEPGVTIITYLHVFNWFSKHYIALAYGILYTTKALAVNTEIKLT